MRRLVVAGAAILAIAAPMTAIADVIPARVIVVSSISQLQSAADQAQPGDRIELVNGTYTTSGSITLRRSGTSTAPITVAAQNVGGAEIRGTAGFSFSGADFVVVEGFRFTHSSSITIPGGSEHVRFTRNVVQLSGGTNWVTVTGNDAEIDHNTFQNKSTQGVFLQIAGPGSNDMAERTWIHHNYFFNHTFSGSNGGESIRLGLSFRQQGSARAIVEHNLFERTDGDSEAISVKSSDNTIRFNTLRNSRGSIVLRHGNRNLVEGNLMLGNTAGIRFYDNDHVVINNVIQGGTGQIIAGSGTVADDTNTTAHARPDRVVVAFNTVVGNRTALLQVGQGTDRLGPNQCTFANNIFVGGGSGGLIDVDEATGTTWQGNIVWAGTGGNAPSSGYRMVNPNLVNTSGINRLSASSPAIDAAAGSYPQVARDLDLQARSGAKDVGADEFVSGSTPRRPLTTADVGPNAGGSEPPPPNRFEAEDATIFHGVVESNHAGFTGTGFVNSDNEIGSHVEWTVNRATAGPVTLVFRFANGTTANRPADITVNGSLVADELSFPGTGAWTTWQTRSVTGTLNAGANSVRATGTTANGGPNLDHLEIIPQAVAGPAVEPMAFVHPGVLVSRAQLDKLRQQVNAGAEPWASAYSAMRASNYASLSWTPKPRAIVECGPSSNPNLGCSDERNDAVAAYTHALQWYITRDSRYAQKAIQIMDAWSAVIQDHTNHNARLQTGWAGASWTRAAELIRHTYTGWPVDRVGRFATMLRNVYLPEIRDGSPNTNGNWELIMMDAMIGIGVFLSDQAVFDRAIGIWRGRVPAYIYLTSDGRYPKSPPGSSKDTPEELIAYWQGQSTFVDGLAQETCRDFGHTGWGFAAAAHVAETAWIQGVNLYGEMRERMLKALEFHANYELGASVPTWLCDGTLDTGLGPTLEVAHNHYRTGRTPASPRPSK